MHRPALAWLGRHSRSAALVAVGILGGGAALALGSVPDTNGTIHACVQVQTNTNGVTVPYPYGGNVRVIDPSAGQACGDNEQTETALNFSQVGPTGATGAPGAPGAQGPQGDQGPAGASGGGAGPASATHILMYLSTSNSSIPVQGEAGGKSPPSGVLGPVTLDSFSFSASNPITIGSATGGAGAGKATFNDLTVTRAPDDLTPLLYIDMATGAHFKQAVIAFYNKASKHAKQPYLTMRLSLVFVRSISEESSGDTPLETLTLAFGAAEITYTPQKADGSLGQPVTQTWNRVTNNNTLTVPGA